MGKPHFLVHGKSGVQPGNPRWLVEEEKMLRRGQIVPGSVLFTEGKRRRSRGQKRVKGPLDDPEARCALSSKVCQTLHATLEVSQLFRQYCPVLTRLCFSHEKQ